MLLYSSLVNLFGNFESYITSKYVTDENLIRNRKMNQYNLSKYILCNKGRTNAIEAYMFMKDILDEDEITITKQAISKQRTYLDHSLFIDMNDDLIKDIYLKHIDEVERYKDYILCSMDESITDIPNHKLTKKEFNIPEDTEFKEYTSTARVSTMVDSNMEFVISSNITYRDISEVATKNRRNRDNNNKHARHKNDKRRL